MCCIFVNFRQNTNGNSKMTEKIADVAGTLMDTDTVAPCTSGTD